MRLAEHPGYLAAASAQHSCMSASLRLNHALNPDASPTALTRRPLGAG
jgi:hypothetical protein